MESRTPKASEIAIGTRNCACTLRFSISGNSPTKVVSEVSTIGRKRTTDASSAASLTLAPSVRRPLMWCTSTRLEFTTTPEAASNPKTDIIDRPLTKPPIPKSVGSSFISQCP